MPPRMGRVGVLPYNDHLSGRGIHGRGMATMTIEALETWLWDAACVIRGPVDAPKFKDYILPLLSSSGYLTF